MSISKDQTSFQKAQDLMRQGQSDQALKLLRQIQSQSPVYPHALYALGTLYMQTDKHSLAEGTFLKLLHLHPDHADSWRNLGLTRYYGLHKPIEAAEAFAKALSHGADPGKIKTYLGLIALHSNDPERAMGFFDEALRHYPEDLLLINSKGQACLLLRDFKSAKFCVLKSLALDPSSVTSGYNALLLADVMSGHEKEQLYAELERTSTAPEISLYLDMLKAEMAGAYNDALALCERITSHNTQLLTRVAFFKANVYRKLGDIDAAWAAYVQANLMERAQPPSVYIDRKIFLRELSTICGCATSAWTKAIVAQDDQDVQKAPAFIVGFPRSGTTLTGSILNAHPEILVTDECPALNKVVEHLVGEMGLSYPADLPQLTRAQRDSLRNIYWAEHQKHPLWREAPLFCDKFPLNIVHIGLIVALFPKAKIIYVQRHPADSVLSAFMQDFQPNAAMVLTQDIAECAQLYMQVRRAYLAQQERLAHPVHILKYESLVQDFDNEVRALLGSLEMDWHEDVRHFSKKEESAEPHTLTPSRKQVEKGLYASALYRWKNYQNHMKDVLPALLKQAKDMGYESD